MNTTWILERNVFDDNHNQLAEALKEKGIRTINWDDQWIVNGKYPKLDDCDVIFHGCLGNAALINEKKIWSPGAFCNVKAFECTSWYGNAEKWLFQKNWIRSTVKEFVESPENILQQIGSDTFFVRPNSPLKPFSGRVLTKDTLSMEALDYGFYYDNPDEEIIVCSIQEMKEEYRYVICQKEVVTGSSYIAENREASTLDWTGAPFELAQEIARELPEPDEVYIIDICNSNDGYKLLELNPFSGADLYNCDRALIVDAISKQRTT